jgi:isocitrate dehydrogenase kinase/phosphatase
MSTVAKCHLDRFSSSRVQMIPAPEYAHHDALARDGARVVCEIFDEYHARFRATARRAARHFRVRDWVAVREESTDRLRLYGRSVDHAIAQIVRRARDATNDRRLWVAMREHYAALIESRLDREIAATFFSSATRRRFGTSGVDSEIEFTRPWSPAPVTSNGQSARRWCDGRAGTRALAAGLLAGLGHALADPDGDALRVGDAVERAARDAFADTPIDGAEVLTPLFYRNKGAYLVGRLHAGARRLPLVLALLADDEGIFVDAVLTSPDEIAVVFGFAWTYFHVDVTCPAETVRFLSELMPLKRVDELYTAIGYNKHGKTELYRTLVRHLDGASGTFEEAPGVKGLVMTVFTLPSLNIVLKIIKDRIGAPKRTTRQRVMDQYHRVFLRDRVGRLADAQLFQGLAFPRECFSESLLEELRSVAPSSVRCEGRRVVVDHVYTERRVRPLNLYVQEAAPSEAVAAILDYGQAIKDLAAANIFPGDLLLKNFGVTRHGRVIFYDYDELAPLTECRFRRIPLARSIDDELVAEPWYSVGESDVFPEEFAPFMVPAGPLRDAFLDAHGDLLDAEWWCAVQERVSAGELVDTFPYPAERRFRR